MGSYSKSCQNNQDENSCPIKDESDTEENSESPSPTQINQGTKPTYQLTKDFINQHDHTPHKFQDWEGKDLKIRSKELKKGTFNHVYEAGVLVACPVQTDPTKHQGQHYS